MQVIFASHAARNSYRSLPGGKTAGGSGRAAVVAMLRRAFAVSKSSAAASATSVASAMTDTALTQRLVLPLTINFAALTLPIATPSARRAGVISAALAAAKATALATFFHGLTLVRFSAQLEPCMTQLNTLHTLNTP